MEDRHQELAMDMLHSHIIQEVASIHIKWIQSQKHLELEKLIPNCDQNKKCDSFLKFHQSNSISSIPRKNFFYIFYSLFFVEKFQLFF